MFLKRIFKVLFNPKTVLVAAIVLVTALSLTAAPALAAPLAVEDTPTALPMLSSVIDEMEPIVVLGIEFSGITAAIVMLLNGVKTVLIALKVTLEPGQMERIGKVVQALAYALLFIMGNFFPDWNWLLIDDLAADFAALGVGAFMVAVLAIKFSGKIHDALAGTPVVGAQFTP